MPSEALISPTDAPPFLRALDHVLPTGSGGWIARCPVFGCENLLAITAVDGLWAFTCDSHTHDEIVAYLALDDLRVDRRPSIRAWLALRLAKTPDAWAGLILGWPVQPEAIDQLELARQRKARLWQ